jgi:hypothetical protein
MVVAHSGGTGDGALNIDKATYDAIPKERRASSVTPRPPSGMREAFGAINRAFRVRSTSVSRTLGIPSFYSSARCDLRVCKSS